MRLLCGDALAVLKTLPSESVQCCVTSPPYWGLRDYGVTGQLGLERTPEEYVAALVAVFAEVRRVLRDDGTLWLNLGDSYAGGGRGGNPDDSPFRKQATNAGSLVAPSAVPLGLKPKDLVGIPWRVAFALQADGWWLRSDIIWSKPNPMPESVRDRPTKAHEYVFLLSKAARYYYDAKAIAEPVAGSTVERLSQPTLDEQAGSMRVPGKTNGPMKAVASRWPGIGPQHATERNRNEKYEPMQTHDLRNSRSVWTIATQPYREAHFAVMPPALAEWCIKAGTKPGDVVLDPFAGAGTTLLVADRLGRDAIGIDLSAEYVEMARKRIAADAPLFMDDRK